MGYTEEYLYAACRCYDPGTPLAPSFKRDYAGWSDSFQDLAVRDDATGDYPLDVDWNTFWDVEVAQNDEGWFAEMRIPISSLRFEPDERGRVVMGLVAMRFIPRNSEVATFPATPANWGTFSHMTPSRARKVVFEGLEPQTPLRVTPYALGGAGQQSVLKASGTAYGLETEPTYDVGLDVKYGLTSNLTLDLTLNTDFAQVEADNQQVNLTRFSLFFPEKRRFFLERSSNFAFNFGAPNRLFYSRRIGVHACEQVRILGGARVVGRSGRWDVGLLNMQTAGDPTLYGRAGERYRPGIGFELRDDFFQVGDRLSYGWLPGGGSRVQAHRINLVGSAFFRNEDGLLESLTLGPVWEMETNTGHSSTVGARHRIEDLKEPFVLSDMGVTADRYTFQEGELSYSTPSSRGFWTRFTLTGGRFFDGHRGSLRLQPTWKTSRYFRLAGVYELDRVTFPDEDQGLTSHVARLPLEVTPDLRYSFQPFIQFNSLGEAILANIRFRYNPREGTDLYVVFNERINTDRSHTQPRLPITTSRALLIKYTYTFGW